MVTIITSKPEPQIRIETPADAVKALRQVQQAARNWIRNDLPNWPIDHERTFQVLISELQCTINNFERNIETDPEF